MGGNGAGIRREGAVPSFGRIPFSEDKKAFYDAFNGEIPLLCRSLPETAQAEALLFFMKYAGIPLGEQPDFFRHYPVPSWSVVYWLTRRARGDPGSDVEDERDAVTAHAMALSLHSLDDHLLDGQMPLNTLSLLLRSQIWMLMNRALDRLATGVQGGAATVRRFQADYHTAMMHPEEPDSLDGYCLRFREEMATGMIVPVLLAKRRKEDQEFIEALENASVSFGVAWRLLDDMRDLEEDLKNRVHSAVYSLLPETMKASWDASAEGGESTGNLGKVLDYVKENGILKKLAERIEQELETAASLAERLALPGMAEEIRCLSGSVGILGDPE